ncbi:two-component sensor histidine kinase, partial [Propionibacterium freudenreichii]|nr:two-component sensor histidine kinase [Propionibacterium freudenreichii]
MLTRRSIARRFLTGAAVVVGVAVVTIFVVDALVSPAIFHAHLMQADLSNPETVLRHVEEGMRSSNMIALAVAILIAVLAALLVSLYLATRVSAS